MQASAQRFVFAIPKVSSRRFWLVLYAIEFLNHLE
jgi:hypothetical protein